MGLKVDTTSLGRSGLFKVLFHEMFRDVAGLGAASLFDHLPSAFSGLQASPSSAFDVKMTKLGFLRLSYEKQDTLLKLLILSMAAVLCKCLLALRVAAGALKGGPRAGATSVASSLL